ncbi:UNVERIFIED_CONTAM: histidine kinase [Euhalothece sp. KZN 001]
MVERRKVQVTGGSTFTVSIPKQWATAHGVEAGSEIEFYTEGESLSLTPARTTEEAEGSLGIDDLAGEELKRAVMTMYVSGFEVMELTATRITSDQRRTIREATQALVGLEVLEETGESIVIRDLLDSAELSIHNAVTRMRLIALSMLTDAVAGVVAVDHEMAADVIERDDDVDRLWMVVSRIFRATLRSPKAAEEVGLDREACFDYQSAARQLERVADHATKIGHLTLQIENPVPDDVREALDELHTASAEVIDLSMAALFAEESTEATKTGNRAREAVQEIDERARAIDELLRELDPSRAQLLGLVVDSVSRSADYGGNIAETALQKAAPTP